MNATVVAPARRARPHDRDAGRPDRPARPLRAWARRGLLHLAGLATPELVAAAAMAVLVVVRQPLNLDVAW